MPKPVLNIAHTEDFGFSQVRQEIIDDRNWVVAAFQSFIEWLRVDIVEYAEDLFRTHNLVFVHKLFLLITLHIVPLST